MSGAVKTRGVDFFEPLVVDAFGVVVLLLEAAFERVGLLLFGNCPSSSSSSAKSGANSFALPFLF